MATPPGLRSRPWLLARPRFRPDVLLHFSIGATRMTHAPKT
jgi:hypothetical protein